MPAKKANAAATAEASAETVLPSAHDLAAVVRARMKALAADLCQQPLETPAGPCQFTLGPTDGNYATLEGQTAEGGVQVTLGVRWSTKPS